MPKALKLRLIALFLYIFFRNRLLIPEKKSKTSSKQFWLTTAGLSLLGLAILSATGVALYRAIAFMHIDSAAIARSYKEVISTHRGQLSQLYVSEGMEVEAGDPLFRLYDDI